MGEFVTWAVILLAVTAVALGGLYALKTYGGGTATAGFFKPKTEPRLSVVEYANVDGKRKLILIRRDEVEHLIMTGGPVDVVVETGIGEAPSRAEARSEPRFESRSEGAATPRPARTFGQARAASAEPDTDKIARA